MAFGERACRVVIKVKQVPKSKILLPYNWRPWEELETPEMFLHRVVVLWGHQKKMSSESQRAASKEIKPANTLHLALPTYDYENKTTESNSFTGVMIFSRESMASTRGGFWKIYVLLPLFQKHTSNAASPWDQHEYTENAPVILTHEHPLSLCHLLPWPAYSSTKHLGSLENLTVFSGDGASSCLMIRRPSASLCCVKIDCYLHLHSIHAIKADQRQQKKTEVRDNPTWAESVHMPRADRLI